MGKSNEELIAAFKKANTERRKKIASNAGYSSPEAYLLSLIFVEKKKKPVKKAAKQMLDYVVAFDTTGSMALYIASVRGHIEKLIPEMFSQDIDLRMRVIAFGDYCDMDSEQSFGKAYQESNFTDDPDHLITFVKNAKNTHGGDGDEFYELVIKKITEETPWRKGSKRVALLIADDGPHSPSYPWFGKSRGIDWRHEAKKAASLNISFDTLAIHGDRYQWYKELSNITNGVYMPFRSQEKMSEVVAASAYVRGSKKSKEKFTACYAAAVASGDDELIGTYKSLNVLI